VGISQSPVCRMKISFIFIISPWSKKQITLKD
jgi:hypothetical protein